MRFAIMCCLAAATTSGFACDYPEQGNTPLRRAITRVEMLPEVHEWHVSMVQKGLKPQYALRLDQPVREAGKCYWPVEVRVDGELWRRYLVTPDGKNVRFKE